MTVLATETFDSIAQGVEVANGNLSPGWIASPGGIATSAAKLHGDRGVRVTNTATRVALDEAQSTAQKCLSHYFKITTMPTGNAYLASVLDAGSVSRADWRVSSAGAVTMRDASIATGGTSTAVLLPNVWYRSEWLLSVGTQELRIYEGESNTPFITLSGTLTNNRNTSKGAGVAASPSGIVLDFDTVRVGDTWVGPYGTPEQPLPTPANFTLTSSTSQVQLTANAGAVTGASKYEVEVEAASGQDWNPVGSFQSATLPLVLSQADGLLPGVLYRGRVRALPA